MTDFPNNYAYLGTADAGDLSSDYNRLKYIIQQQLDEMSTATVVKIIRAPYDANGNNITPGSAAAIGYVDVQPMVGQIDGYGQITKHGTVYRLSYHRYQGGNGAFITDPVIGDIGKMVVSDRDTSVVRKTSDLSPPGSGRRYDKADGTFFGQTQAGAPKQFWSFTATGARFQDLNGNTIITTNQGVLINGVLITLAGDVVAKNGVSLENHVHSGIQRGSSDTDPPVT